MPRRVHWQEIALFSGAFFTASRRVFRRISALTRGRVLGFVLVFVLCVIRVMDPAPVELLRNKSFDQYQRIQPRDGDVGASRQVVVIDIDEQSLAALGQWPWPRTLLAQLVDRLTKMGAAVIGFDIFFVERDRMSPDLFANDRVGLSKSVIAELMQLRSNDSVFAQSISRSRVVLGQTAVVSQINLQNKLPRAGPVALVGGDPAPYLWTYQSAIGNIDELSNAASGRGMVTLKSDEDGVVRRVPAILRVGSSIYPALTIEMLRVATGQSAYGIRMGSDGVKDVVVQGIKIPTDRHGQLYPYYRSHKHNLNSGMYVSASDVVSGKVAASTIRGRLVLVGTSAAGLLDIRVSPLGENLPGVEVHANLLENILTQTLLERPRDIVGIELTITLVAGLLVVLFLPMIGAAWGAGVLVVLLGTALGVSWHMYENYLMLTDATFPVFTIFALYTILTYTNYSRTAAERRQVRQAFNQYLSPALMDQLARDPERLTLGGEMKNMTLLFADVRGFTTISEQFKDDPEGLTSLINRFLTPMTNIILERKGTIDKYMGDCIMAFWNAPLDDENHAENACAAALQMIDAVEELNTRIEAERAEHGQKSFPIKIGIGLNTGVCCVGNMGSTQRFDYSVLGDTVNLAARLEGQSKNYGVDIVVGPETRSAATDWAALELDLISVKGKTEPVNIFGLLGGADVVRSDEFASLSLAHEAMLSAYRGQNWAEANTLLGKCRVLDSRGILSALYDLYNDRIEAFMDVPPDSGWDGVFVAQTK